MHDDGDWIYQSQKFLNQWMDEWISYEHEVPSYLCPLIVNVLQERDITFNLLFIIHISYIWYLNFIYGFMEPIIVVS